MLTLHTLHRLRHLALTLATAMLSATAHAEPLEVVASFSILGDFVQAVGGARTRVVTLVGPGSDAHDYQPRPSDARAVRAADVVIANGLGFDTWIARLAESAGRSDAVVIVSVGISPLVTADTHDHESDDKHHHGQAQFDPHAWQSVANARHYVTNIANTLTAHDPDGAAHYAANAQRYIASLDTLEHEIRTGLASLQQAQRTVVTSHDAFGYFAAAYGIRFVAASGISGEAETSAAEIARLIRLLRSENAQVAFVENIADPRLITRISEESGARIGGTLYSDTLSEAGGPAPTYIEMMRHNLRTLLAGLQPAPR